MYGIDQTCDDRSANAAFSISERNRLLGSWRFPS
jgi:hypothetical protein